MCVCVYVQQGIGREEKKIKNYETTNSFLFCFILCIYVIVQIVETEEQNLVDQFMKIYVDIMYNGVILEIRQRGPQNTFKLSGINLNLGDYIFYYIVFLLNPTYF